MEEHGVQHYLTMVPGKQSVAWNSALHDCGASKPVCDKEWLIHYIAKLPEQEQEKITFTSSN